MFYHSKSVIKHNLFMKNLENSIILDINDQDFLKKIPFLIKDKNKNFHNVLFDLFESIGDFIGIQSRKFLYEILFELKYKNIINLKEQSENNKYNLEEIEFLNEEIDIFWTQKLKTGGSKLRMRFKNLVFRIYFLLQNNKLEGHELVIKNSPKMIPLIFNVLMVNQDLGNFEIIKICSV